MYVFIEKQWVLSLKTDMSTCLSCGNIGMIYYLLFIITIFKGILMKIRKAKETDTASISSLILKTSKAHIRDEFTDGGWELFKRLFSEDCQRALLKNKQYYFLIAEHHEQIIGMLALKDASHLFQFFISTDWQKQGVGTMLWKYYLDTIKAGKLSKKHFKTITVNASDFGRDFYLKLGFEIAGKRQMKKGVYFNPLHYSLNHKQ